eukprot:CAMPEP_0197183142 /NCGR_PEP_ID=MMETSP1423-20130617/7530_1 /TAXON_ID=476441 /ORGANISM="Pseudo-nitzschia heimii, Strain UNC1101" /LENGTH=141 /DNA_ID=CAMNT_0042633691 /DNA_START=48 /DNA_END=473 /DNA_ORIENTATION=-
MIVKPRTFASIALLAASNAFAASASHYEKPPCGPDEKAVQLMGIDGVFCSPQCQPDCPDDTPDGVTAVPSCALQSPDGAKYCAILCSPKNEEVSLFGSDCGSEMSCVPVPGAGGLGVCVYPMSKRLGAFPWEPVAFAATIE